MNSHELNEIAKTYVDTLLAQNLTKAELVMVVALIQARVMSIVNVTTSVTTLSNTGSTITEGMAPKPDIGVIEGIASLPEPPIRKSVPYDPETDPAPDIDIVEPPPREDTKGKVLAQSNKVCICSKCNRIMYVTNRTIIDGMLVKDFIEAFTPSEGIPVITRKTEIQNIDGNISMDCPDKDCHGNKTLYLIGKKSTSTGGLSSIITV
jgi:hypothetical protein